MEETTNHFIKIITHLDLTTDGPVLKNGDELVHLQQGDMDGACGPYSLMMCMMIVGAVSRYEAVGLHDMDGRTKLGRLRDNLLAFGSLVKDGTTHEDLDWLTGTFENQNGDVLEAHYIEENNTKDLSAQVSEYLDDDLPVIVGIEWQGGGGHWAVAVGYEYTGDHVKRLFLLDPGFPTSPLSYWNAVLDLTDDDGEIVNKGRLPSNHLTPRTEEKAKLASAIVIE
jgi:hypothetical protein